MLANLPDDCVLTIFGFLDEKDLDEIKCVSCQMFDLACVQLMSIPKKLAEELRVVESEVGHAFQLSFGGNDNNYVYAVDNGEHPKEIRALYRNNEDFAYPCTISTVARHDNVPDALISTLEKLLDRNIFSELVLEFLRIDSSFLGLLERATFEIRTIELNYIKVDEGCIERFCLFILDHPIRSIKIANPDIALCEMFNEKFLETFSRDNESSELIINYPDEIDPTYQFSASENVIGNLIIFKTLKHESLTLNGELVPELLEKRLKCRREGLIIISITVVPNKAILDRMFQFLSNNKGYYTYLDAQSRSQATICFADNPLTNQTIFRAKFSNID